MAVQRFCAFCGASRADEQAKFCGSCGRSFIVGPEVPYGGATARDSALTAAPEWPARPADPLLPSGTAQPYATQRPAWLASARKRPLWAVFLMTAGTFSVYFFVHLGLMWAEMKRAREDPTMNPVGHAFAQFVPFYGWARFHAHVRTLDEMLESAGSSHRVSAGLATVTYVVLGVFGLVAGSTATPAWMVFPSFAAYGLFAAWRQHALNAYYDQISQRSIPERTHGFEWVVVILGILLLALAAIGIFLPVPEG
jgi:hypothetical protein